MNNIEKFGTVKSKNTKSATIWKEAPDWYP